jgi:hypothetical protein
MSDIARRYLIDTSVFVQAYRQYYTFKVCPGFWTCLASLHRQGIVCSIDRVFDEICYGDEDELSMWAKKTMPKEFFGDSTTIEVVRWYGQIQQWAHSQTQFSPAAKSEFADAEEADAWLIAYAGAKNLTLVTQETYNAEIKRKIPIPNVCKANEFRVPVINIYDMLERCGITFTWSENSN